MGQPAEQAEQDELEVSVDASIALCDGDVRAALKASIVYSRFLEGMASSGYRRKKPTPQQQAADTSELWRAISFGEAGPEE